VGLDERMWGIGGSLLCTQRRGEDLRAMKRGEGAEHVAYLIEVK